MKAKKLKKQEGLRIRATPFFKLQKEKDRHYVGISLRKQFGFLPEQIIIERLTTRNNVVRVVAVLTEAEIKKEEALSVKIKK